MKIRETLNNNTEKFTATAYENGGKIVVVKRDTANYYDNSTDEKFEFSAVSEYQEWKAAQSWIVSKKTKTVSPFKNVSP